MAPRGRDNGTHQNTKKQKKSKKKKKKKKKKDDNKIKQRKIVFSLIIANPTHGNLVLKQFLSNGISHLY